MKITIVGIGYVGLVTSAYFAEYGHEIVCIDNQAGKIDQLKNGVMPFYEEGLEELIKKNKMNLSFTSDSKSVYSNSTIVFICVGTPEKRDGSANLNYIYNVADELTQYVQEDCIVVVKSTVPIGANDKLEVYLNSRQKNNVKFDVVSNPEFLAQGTAVRDIFEAERLVFGTQSKHAENVLYEIYKDFKSPVISTDRKSAEMIKYAANNFLALKISYINEIANLCDVVGANVQDVSIGMGLDSRIGSKFLNPGIGYGGSCFPKDTKALHWLASFHDYELKTIKAAIEVNENQKLKLIKKARKYFESFDKVTVAVLGLTFKPGTDDLREAPSLENIPIILEDGGKVNAWDPEGVENFKKVVSNDIHYCSTPIEALKGADICFIFTEWDEVKALSPNDFIENMNSPIVLDGRNCYNVDKMKQSKMIYESIGRSV